MGDVVLTELSTRPMVFFSYASADEERVDQIAKHARAVGVEPYMAAHDYQPGRQLSDKIVNAIERSDAVFVFLTQQGYDTKYVHQEIGIAVAKSRVVIALVDPELLDGGQDFALLEGIEVVPFSFENPKIEDLVPLVTVLHRITQNGQGAELKERMPSGSLNVSIKADLQLTVDDVLKGILVAGLVIGVIYLASRPPGASM